MLPKNLSFCNSFPVVCLKGGSSNTPPQPQSKTFKYLLLTTYGQSISSWLTFVNRPLSSSSFTLGATPAYDYAKAELVKFKIDIGIDYLMGTLKVSDPDPFIKYLCSVYDLKFELKEHPKHHGCYEFTHQLIDPVSGGKIYYLFDEINDVYILAVILPGEVVRSVSKLDNIHFIIRSVAVYRLCFTVIDIKIDDYLKRVDFSFLHKLAKKGHVAGSQKYLFLSGGVVGDYGASKADTIYFGSKRSNLKVYNSDFIRQDNAYRWEGRFREKKCTTIINYLINNFNDFESDDSVQLSRLFKYLGNKVLNIAKFIHRKSKKQSTSRYKTYRFYQSLLDDVGELDPSILKDDFVPRLSTAELLRNSFKWFNRQVFKRLFTIKESFGNKLFYSTLDKMFTLKSMQFTDKDNILLCKLSNHLSQINPLHRIDYVNSLVYSFN